MKKILCLTLGLAAAGSSFAQKSNVKEAGKQLELAGKFLAPDAKNEALADDALNKAKTAIDAAVLDESTKGKYETWFTKATLYVTMMESQALSAGKPYREGAEALKKAVELNKKTTSEAQFPSVMLNAAFYYYNDGASAQNNNQFEDSYKFFGEAYDLLNLDGGAVAKTNNQDTLMARALQNKGYSAFYGNKLDEAETILKQALANPISAQSDVYLVLSQLYGKQKQNDKQLAIINEGKTKFPGDKNMSAAELNYYIENGKQEEMISKLEEAVAADPSNPALPYNLGIVYKDMYNNPSVTDKAQYFQKAEKSYSKSLELAPENPSYAYELGALYFNEAVSFNNEMNKTGTSAAEQKKYDGFKAQRDGMFGKALPYLEKAAQQFEANKKSLGAQELTFYRQSLDAMVKIYAIQDQMDKMNAAKDKLNSLN